MKHTPLLPSGKPWPMKPRKPMGLRKHRRPGNRPMTPAEATMVTEAKVTLCIPCLAWSRAGNMPREHVATCSAWDHKKSGNVRRGHDKGFASCDWHHQRLKPDDWTFAQMAAYFGPSLLDGSARFARTYGTDDALIAMQADVLAGRVG